MYFKTRFPGLNELRALAALSIIPGHVEQVKARFNIPHTHWFPIPGKLGVILFFSLSGFLITTLLLNEKAGNGRINLNNFYHRRVLRIWPLYFLIVGLSLLILYAIPVLQTPSLSLAARDNMTWGGGVLLLLVLPNYLGFVIPYAGMLWSIGIEEQFYLVQPVIIKMLKNIVALITFLFSIIFLKEILTFGNHYFNSALIGKVASQADYFGCIAIGSLGALIHNSHSRFFNALLKHKMTQALSIVAFVVFLWMINSIHNVRVIDFRLHAIIFTIFVVNTATNESSFLRINNKALNRVGDISYGVYMFHPIGIGFAIAIATRFPVLMENYALLNSTIYLLTIFFTFGISWVSYKYFESYFLHRKEKWNR